ncbi:hypothetical protein [Nonomuraea sp. NPDC049646]|uniref:hypothetical protein n=1 Tax=unclassified Nonomuraea TaxID=2593643 RepID=UPI00378EAD22
MTMPENSCPGPCNSQARRLHDAYDQAIDRHDYEMLLHLDALERHQHAIATWRAPLIYPAEPTPPARPEPPTIPVPVGDPVWCSNCPKKIRNALYRINELAPVIYADITGHRGAAPTGPNGRRTPDSKTVIERLDEMYGDLSAIANFWKEYRRHPVRPSLNRGADARQLVIAYLLEQLDHIVLHPGSVDFGLNVLLWEKRLTAMAKADPVARHSPIACPRCREPKVYRGDDGYYTCKSCGRLLNQEEHDRHFAAQAEEHERERQEVRA